MKDGGWSSSVRPEGERRDTERMRELGGGHGGNYFDAFFL